MRRLATSLLPILSAAGSAQDVLVVDQSGLGDYLEIQAAVNAAADGDLLLIKEGQYAPTAIAAKRISLIADEDEIVSILGGLHIVGTLAGQDVLVVGLRIVGSTEPLLQNEAVVIEACAGAVRIEDAILKGGVEWDGGFNSPGREAVRLSAAADVACARTSLLGGHGQPTIGGGPSSAGGTALLAADSVVYLHDCLVRGGDGADGDLLQGCLAGWAGIGIHATDSELYLANSSVRGGDGGGDELFDCHPGGTGMHLSGATSLARHRQTSFAGGQGADHGACNAADGAPIVLQGSASEQPLAGALRSYDLTTPVRSGAPLTVTFTGEPGDAAYAMLSTTAGSTWFPALEAPLLCGLPLLGGRRYLGQVPAGGVLTVTFLAPGLAPGAEHLLLCTQGLFLDSNGDAWLSSPSAMVVLDPGL